MRSKTLFDDGWKFILDDKKEYAEAGADERSFREVRLPHDWSLDYPLSKDNPTGGGGGYARAGIGWYRKHFSLEDLGPSEMAELLFEGVYMDSTVYVNGVKAGGHGYGYTSFYVDMTPYLKEGDNVVAVRVNNSYQPNSRWYSGSGIYRDVYLERHEKIFFDHFGIRCATNGIYSSMDQAAVQILSSVRNLSDEEVHVGIIHKIYDSEGKLVSSSGIALYLEPGEVSDCYTRPGIDHPHLWSDDDPYLYTMVSQVKLEDTVLDEQCNRIGIRTATFDAKRGFLLNGKRVKIKGMCIHHDCGCTGAVGYEESWRRRLKKLRDMGCNGIRCAHNPPTPILLDICDELGFLVMDEAFDEWYLSKNKNDNYYSESLAFGASMFFKNHAKEDITTMVRRDFNHPSVILWSIGNEIPEQSSIDGPKIARMLQDIVHEEDATRMVTSACDNIAAVENARTLREFECLLDVTGYNYVGRWREREETYYDEDHAEFPERRMIGTENGSVGSDRGIYEFGEKNFFGFEPQKFAYETVGNEALWRYTVSRDFVAGDYLWTGIGYLGETRWPRRGAEFGPIDTAGFEKDAYYYFRSIWNNKEDTLHIAPTWNFHGEEGVYKQIVVFTSCDEVELYVNDRLVGKRGFKCPRYGAVKSFMDTFGKNTYTTSDLHLNFDVAYEPGTLKAIGYKDGKAVMETVVETTGEAKTLKAELYEKQVKPFGIAQIEISSEDEKGRFVPDNNDIISCEIEGKARLIGMDAGNAEDLSMYSEKQRRMLSGRLLCVIQPEEAGEVRVHFTSESGLKTTCVINVTE